MMGNREYRMADRVAYWLLCSIVFDCAAFGGGSVIKILGIDFRMVLFALFFLISLPAVFRNLKSIFLNGYFLTLLAWGIWLVVSTVRGYLAGNRLDLIISAWVGFASFGLLPGVLAILKNKEQAIGLMKTICVASFVLAIQSIAVLIIYNVDIDTFVRANYWMIYHEIGGSTGVNRCLVRIFMRSHPYMVFGCACSLYFMTAEQQKRISMLHGANIALCLLSLVLSYTRSIYLCAGVTAGLTVAFLLVHMGKRRAGLLGRKLTAVTGMFLALLVLCDLVFGGFFLSYAISRSTGFNLTQRLETVFGIDNSVPHPDGQIEIPEKDPGQEDALNIWSDTFRDQTEEELGENISRNPVFGSGLGATLEVRPDGYNEYFFMDMVYKTGVVGLLLYLAPMIMMLLWCCTSVHKTELHKSLICAIWLSGLLGFAAFSFYNPYLNGSNGITLYCCTIGVFSVLNPRQQIHGFHHTPGSLTD